jgi:hypothetical protein
MFSPNLGGLQGKFPVEGEFPTRQRNDESINVLRHGEYLLGEGLVWAMGAYEPYV